jgi:hypothetical protein
MAKEWANKDRYHPSHGVPEPRMPLPKGKGFVCKVPAWGDERSRSRGGGLERAVRSARQGGQTGPPQGRAVRPALPRFLGSSVSEVMMLVVSVPLVMVQMVDTFEFGGVEFAGRSPPRDQYEFGRGRSFESQRGYGPRFPFRGTCTPPVRRQWFSHGGSRFDRFDRMDRSFDRRGRMDVANPTFEEMARHWFHTFGSNPSVESFARSLSCF